MLELQNKQELAAASRLIDGLSAALGQASGKLSCQQVIDIAMACLAPALWFSGDPAETADYVRRAALTQIAKYDEHVGDKRRQETADAARH